MGILFLVRIWEPGQKGCFLCVASSLEKAKEIASRDAETPLTWKQRGIVLSARYNRFEYTINRVRIDQEFYANALLSVD